MSTLAALAAWLLFGYIRASTEEQADSGLGLEAQRAKLAEEARRQGWDLVEVLADEGVSAKEVDNRPGLQAALCRVEAGERPRSSWCRASSSLAQRPMTSLGCR